MTRSVRLSVFWILALLAGSVVPAAAQTAAPELALGVGYQVLHIPDSTSPLGFNVDVNAARNEVWGIVGEVGLSHHDEEGDDTGSANVFHFGGGVRLNWPLTPTVSGFVQAIAGVEVAKGEFDTDSAFMLQPGAGVVASMSERWGVFVQADFRPVFFAEEVDEQFRFVVGARMTLR
jgi:Outer membrane protein beta-barrel domain